MRGFFMVAAICMLLSTGTASAQEDGRTGSASQHSDVHPLVLQGVAVVRSVHQVYDECQRLRLGAKVLMSRVSPGHAIVCVIIDECFDAVFNAVLDQFDKRP